MEIRSQICEDTYLVESFLYDLIQIAFTSFNILNVVFQRPELFETIVLCRLPYENKEVVLPKRVLGLCKDQNTGDCRASNLSTCLNPKYHIHSVTRPNFGCLEGYAVCVYPPRQPRK